MVSEAYKVCKVAVKALLSSTEGLRDHAIWLRQSFPKVASRFIRKWPEYASLKAELEIILKNGAKTWAEALFLFAHNEQVPYKCIQCPRSRSYSIGGKAGYPNSRGLCAGCSRYESAARGVQTKCVVGDDGLTTHQRLAYKAHATKRITFNEFGVSMHDQISAKSAPARSRAMAKYVAELQAKAATADMTDAALYVIHDDVLGAFKIGRSKDPVRRITDMQKHVGRQFLTMYIGGGKLCKIARLEIDLHEYFEEDNLLQPKGFPGRTEWFSDSIAGELDTILEDLVDELKPLYFEGVGHGIRIS
jgi:hypothetical protein